ncbi:MAG: molybdenum cofactor biosynthesis protein MoaE [Micrococcales bacterium]|nr:molybdenum cofactor biosynthesis protein MoaE [Micrococcales bacterium]
MLVSVTDQPLVPADVEASVRHREAGAVVCFVGTVRDHDEGQAVTALRYEAHPDAEQMLTELVAQFRDEHPDVLGLAVVHRYGELVVGDVACVVAVSCAHRADAFATCGALLELVKAEAPIWKHQTYADGRASWVTAS